MNYKHCGCGNAMPSKAMPRCMAMKPDNTCRMNNWSNDNARNAKTCATPCNMGCDKKSDCTCNVLGNENKCGTKCNTTCGMQESKKCDGRGQMLEARTCGSTCNMPVARTCGKTCEMPCAKKYGQEYEMPRKYRRCAKGCELTFGEEVNELPAGMAYVPYQEWDCNVSNACQGLYDGTIFPELVKPFVCTYCYEERSCR